MLLFPSVEKKFEFYQTSIYAVPPHLINDLLKLTTKHTKESLNNQTTRKQILFFILISNMSQKMLSAY